MKKSQSRIASSLKCIRKRRPAFGWLITRNIRRTSDLRLNLLKDVRILYESGKSYSVPFKVNFLAGGKVNEENKIDKISCLFFIIDNAWFGTRCRYLGG